MRSGLAAGLLGLLCSYAVPGFAADTVRNGGDVVTCHAASGAAFQGAFVLDYLVGASKAGDGASELAPVEGDDLVTYLLTTVPSLGSELDQFMADAALQIGATPIWARRNVWRQSSLGLNDLRDEQLTSPLPDNCKGADGSVELSQAVVRETMPGARGRVFNYDPRNLGLIQDDAMQMSFLLVHEWLWYHADNADMVRNLNWFLHSQRLRSMPEDAVIWELANMGFVFSTEATPAPTIRIEFNGQAEPNGRPRFTVPSTVIMKADAPEIRIVNTGAERFLIRLEGDNIVDLCLLQRECVLKAADLPALPLVLIVERSPLADPIWDAKRVIVVR